MPLYLPPQAAADQRRRFEADVMARIEPHDRVSLEWTRALRRVDEQLMMVKAKETIEVGTPLVPGYYHVLRFNGEEAPMSIFTLHADGRFIEPNSRVFDRLAAGNLHDPRVFRLLEDLPRKAHEAAERQRARENEERRDELRERVNAVTRAQVSMDTAVPWTQNSQGRRKNGRKR